MNTLNPSHNTEAEAAVLGALLLEGHTMLPMCLERGLCADHFHDSRNRMVFETILAASKQRRGLDLITVGEALAQSGRMDDIGRTYMDGLVDACVTVAHTEYYLDILFEHALRRELAAFGRELENSAKDPDNPAEMVAKAETRLLAMKRHDGRGEPTPTQAAEAAKERWRRAVAGGSSGMPSRFACMSSLLGGYSEYTIVAARPSVGKSTLMLNEALHCAAAGRSVAIASLEMSKEQCLARMGCDHANVNLFALDTGHASTWQRQQAEEGIDTVAALQTIHITDRPHTPETLCSWARRMKIKHDIQMLWVDYLQILTPSQRYANGNERVQDFSRALLMLRKEIGVPVVVLCQLSRSVEHRDTQVPRLADLRDSGAIEQDAHTVVMLYRKPGDDETVVFDVAKNRNGPLGRRFLRPAFNRQRFEDKPDMQDEEA